MDIGRDVSLIPRAWPLCRTLNHPSKSQPTPRDFGDYRKSVSLAFAAADSNGVFGACTLDSVSSLLGVVERRRYRHQLSYS